MIVPLGLAKVLSDDGFRFVNDYEIFRRKGGVPICQSPASDICRLAAGDIYNQVQVVQDRVLPVEFRWACRVVRMGMIDADYIEAGLPRVIIGMKQIDR